MTSPTWTVLVPTLGQRAELLCQMLDGLLPQVDAAGGQVKILAYWDNGDVSIAAKKQALVEAADSDYVSFVDDDDTVSDDYVSSIVEALASRPDQVGLKMQVYSDGRPFVLSHHSLRHGGWLNHGKPYYRRDITCANPMRTDIVRTARFTVVKPGEPEDVPWAEQLRAGGLLRTEVFVDRILYHYWWSYAASTWIQPDRRIDRINPSNGRPWRAVQVDSPHFAWHPASTLFTGGAGARPSRHRPGTHSQLEHRTLAERMEHNARMGFGGPVRRG